MKRVLPFLILIVAGGSLLFAGGEAEEAPEEERGVAEVELMEESLQWNTWSDYVTDTGESVDGFQEAPELREQVEAGELPPVEDRLPEDPPVMRATEAVGEYGGTFRRAWLGPGDHWSIRHHLREIPVYMTQDGSIEPNLFKDYEINGDGEEYIFHMREGLRWDDGEPMDAYDAEFWWEIKLDDRLYHPHRSEYLVNGEKPEVEVIDDYTWSITFPGPNPLFLEAVSREGRADLVAPRHYLEQFHADYVSEEEMEATLEEEGHDDWSGLFDAKYQIVTNPERPHWFAFRATGDPSDSEYVWERNPYYFKVDEDGKQLPYLDDYRNEYVTEMELITSLVLGGEISGQSRHIGIEDWALLMDNRDRGNYEVYPRVDPDIGSHGKIQFNLTHHDDMVREVFQDVRFRRAMSSAIDREEINEIVLFGLGEPRQMSWTEFSPYYDPEWEQAYVEHDPELANELLDEMGLEFGDDGYRTYPDGSRLRFSIVDIDARKTETLELLEQHWEEVGVDLEIDVLERTLWEERSMAGDYDAQIWHGDRAWNPHLRPASWSPRERSPNANHWATEWNRYLHTDGREGEEPPEDMLRSLELLRAAQSTVDPDERAEYMAELAHWHRENLVQIGTVGSVPEPMVVQNNLRNAHVFPADHMYELDGDDPFIPTLWWDD